MPYRWMLIFIILEDNGCIFYQTASGVLMIQRCMQKKAPSCIC